MKLGPISITWQSTKVSSAQDPNKWLLDSTPEGKEEEFLFSNPELLTSNKDVRDVLDNINLAADIRMKRRFERFAYRVAFPWILLLIATAVFQGFGFWGFDLETAEFVTLITTTTATVIGLAYIVGNYLFGQKMAPKD